MQPIDLAKQSSVQLPSSSSVAQKELSQTKEVALWNQKVVRVCPSAKEQLKDMDILSCLPGTLQAVALGYYSETFAELTSIQKELQLDPSNSVRTEILRHNNTLVQKVLQEAQGNFDAITDAGLKKVLTSPSVANTITTLDLSGMDITDKQLETIVKTFPNLTSLNLAECEDITDAGLAHLAQLHALTSLDLAYCSNITDAGLAHLAQLHALTSLNLYGCSNITDAGRDSLKQKLPQLNTNT